MIRDVRCQAVAGGDRMNRRRAAGFLSAAPWRAATSLRIGDRIGRVSGTAPPLVPPIGDIGCHLGCQSVLRDGIIQVNRDIAAAHHPITTTIWYFRARSIGGAATPRSWRRHLKVCRRRRQTAALRQRRGRDHLPGFIALIPKLNALCPASFTHRARRRITFPNSGATSSSRPGATRVPESGLRIVSTATPAFNALMSPNAST